MDHQPTPSTPPETQPQQHHEAAPTHHATSEPRNFLAAFLLTTLGGYLGLRHFYLGDKKLGWLRTGLYVGGFLFILLTLLLEQGVLALLGVFAITVATIWAIVDFFYVYLNVKTDAEGNTLAATNRDKKWAKVIFWVTVIGAAAYILLIVGLASFGENAYRNQPNGFDQFESSSSDSLFDENFRTY